MTTIPQDPGLLDTDAVADRLLTAALGAVDVLAGYLGDRLGWYRSLAVDGPATSEQLAERTGTHPRYTREWLEQQAVTGLLQVDDGRRYVLPPAAAEVLTDEGSLSYLAPLTRMLAASSVRSPSCCRRTGPAVGSAGRSSAPTPESRRPT